MKPIQPIKLIKKSIRPFHFILFPLSFILAMTSCSSRYSLLSYHSSPYFQKIDKILDDSLVNKGETGIRVISAKNGDVLYDKDSDKFFPPASGMKVITTAGAVFFLKPEFRFRTLILSNVKVTNDTLRGNILLKGQGDPTLRAETLCLFARQLRLKGISTILGDIVFDDSFFDTIPYGKGWMWDDLEYGFSAPISALSVNGNTLRVFVAPGKNKGDSLKIDIEPKTGFVTIKNQAVTGEKNNISVTSGLQRNRNIIAVNGSLTQEAKQQIFVRSVKNPSLFTASLFSEILKKNRITVLGKIRKIYAETYTDTLLVHLSEPLVKMLYDMDKHSSNFVAEMTLKTIGAEERGIPGTTEKGIEAIASFLKEKRIAQSTFSEVDGSGLSRYNLISPEIFTSLLFYLYHSFEYAPEFLTVLPTSGIDGTLKNRMEEEDLQRRVRAKTGTMTGVSTLSGYCITHSGKILIFSIMMKDYIASPTYVRKIQDKIVKTLIEF